ncbi:MAG: isoprenylcysteine carboxylmethyltransferase family protein, partial [Gemmatimonadaceae bacterium]|nr:isoprenylcysteine carboxylmethyltransferase family protein [Gemmatimonadaceae bacterium]
MAEGDRDTAGVIAPPPLIFAIPLIVGLVANWLSPLPILTGRVGLWMGIALAIAGLGLIVTGIIEFRHANTAVVPFRPTTAIVSSGPFRFTRNPLYLGFVLIYIGASLAANTLWPLFMLPLAILVLLHGVVKREERYL